MLLRQRRRAGGGRGFPGVALRTASVLLLAGVAGPNPRPAASADAGLQIEHTPPSCLLAGRVPRLVACLVPRSSKAALRVFFRAEGQGEAYSSALRSDVPCYSALLPRPSGTSARVSYWFEAQAPGQGARSADYEVAVVTEAAACPGRVATIAKERATWDVPAGAPRIPPGFEGTTAVASTAPQGARATTATAPAPPSTTGPARPAPPPSAPDAGSPSASGGGHGLRNVALVGLGVAAAGGAAVAISGDQDSGSGPAATTGTGLPPTGVSGVYVGTETVNYPGGCVGTDDIVLNLQEAGGLLSGVLTFTVRSCACCSAGRGANPVSGSLSGTSLSLATPIGFNYSGSFAGNRLAGPLAAPGGITGSWTVDKR